MSKEDAVNHPNHYMFCGFEAIDIIRAVLGPKAFWGYCIGNVLKYVLRHKRKGKPVEDLKKAQVYLGWAIDALEEDGGI